MNEALMLTVLEALMFLELSGDEAIDPDTAVSQMESLATILNHLTPDERETFIKYASKLARTEKARGESKRAMFLQSLPENIGWVSE